MADCPTLTDTSGAAIIATPITLGDADREKFCGIANIVGGPSVEAFRVVRKSIPGDYKGYDTSLTVSYDAAWVISNATYRILAGDSGAPEGNCSTVVTLAQRALQFAGIGLPSTRLARAFSADRAATAITPVSFHADRACSTDQINSLIPLKLELKKKAASLRAEHHAAAGAAAAAWARFYSDLGLFFLSVGDCALGVLQSIAQAAINDVSTPIGGSVALWGYNTASQAWCTSQGISMSACEFTVTNLVAYLGRFAGMSVPVPSSPTCFTQAFSIGCNAAKSVLSLFSYASSKGVPPMDTYYSSTLSIPPHNAKNIEGVPSHPVGTAKNIGNICSTVNTWSGLAAACSGSPVAGTIESFSKHCGRVFQYAP